MNPSHFSSGPALEKAEWFEQADQTQVTEARPPKARWPVRQRGAGSPHRSPRSSKEARSRALHSSVSAASGCDHHVIEPRVGGR